MLKARRSLTAGRVAKGCVMQARRGVASLEFALIAPVLILLCIGVFDLARAMIVQEQVWNAAHTIPVSASSLAVQPDRTTSLTVAQVQQTLSGIFASMPWLRSGGLTGETYVVMSSVNFIKVQNAWRPELAWSVAYAGHGLANFVQRTRSCNPAPVEVAAVTSAAGSLLSLPVLGIANPAPILVVDVYYQFTPMLFGVASGPFGFWASGYWPIRSAAPGAASNDQYTRYDIANEAGGSGKCPGYTQ